MPELRKHRSSGMSSIRWRIRAEGVLQEHKTLFQQHGMPEDHSKGHTLETPGMATALAEDMLRRLKQIINADDSFLNRYLACYAVTQQIVAEAVEKQFPKIDVVAHSSDPLLGNPRWRNQSASAADVRQLQGIPPTRLRC